MKRLDKGLAWEAVAVEFENVSEFSLVTWACKALLEDKVSNQKAGYAWAKSALYDREIEILQAIVAKLEE